MSNSGVADNTDRTFEVSRNPETVIADPSNEEANVCRVAALSTMLGADSEVIRSLSPQFDDLGFAEALTSGERLWTFPAVERLPDFSELLSQNDDLDRVALWNSLNQEAQASTAVAFLVSVLGSELERESAAAASALWREFGNSQLNNFTSWSLWNSMGVFWHEQRPLWPWIGLPWPLIEDDLEVPTGDLGSADWNPTQWSDTFNLFLRLLRRPDLGLDQVTLIASLSRLRLGVALQSRDTITRSLAIAAFLPSETSEDIPTRSPFVQNEAPQVSKVSTMIHGTRGWKGDWWEPDGDFHQFILSNYRDNLYQEGAPFSWSGAYSKFQRQLASTRFQKWCGSMAMNGVQSVFGHSYGGEVAARAIINGVQTDELVLLSVPVTNYVEASVPLLSRLVDIRLAFDPVLGLARARQRFPDHLDVTRVVLKKWRLDHGATHKRDVWLAEEIATKCEW